MKLSLEVKGYLIELLGRYEKRILTITIRRKLGVDSIVNGTNLYIAEQLVESLPEGNETLLIKICLDNVFVADKPKVLNELKDLMERTMQCSLDENLNIIPIFDSSLEIQEKQTFIEKKLDEFGFRDTLSHYKGAVKVYNANKKGSVALLRPALASLVNNILKAKNERVLSNHKDNLVKLRNIGILKEIENYDNEVEYSYALYGILSNYGSHEDEVTEELANFLYTSATTFIWFLINRYESSL